MRRTALLLSQWWRTLMPTLAVCCLLLPPGMAAGQSTLADEHSVWSSFSPAVAPATLPEWGLANPSAATSKEFDWGPPNSASPAEKITEWGNVVPVKPAPPNLAAPSWLPRYDLNMRIDVDQHLVTVKETVTW